MRPDVRVVGLEIDPERIVPGRDGVSFRRGGFELAGLRPVDHLARWTSPSLFEALARRAGLAARILGGQSSPRRPRIRSVRTELTMSGACEATVLLEEGNRVRAAAARLELLRERWILTGLEMA